MTSSTLAGSMPVRSTSALSTTAPRSPAVMLARLPWNLPTAVRMGETMAARRMGTSSDRLPASCGSRRGPSRASAGPARRPLLHPGLHPLLVVGLAGHLDQQGLGGADGIGRVALQVAVDLPLGLP